MKLSSQQRCAEVLAKNDRELKSSGPLARFLISHACSSLHGILCRDKTRAFKIPSGRQKEGMDKTGRQKDRDASLLPVEISPSHAFTRQLVNCNLWPASFRIFLSPSSRAAWKFVIAITSTPRSIQFPRNGGTVGLLETNVHREPFEGVRSLESRWSKWKSRSHVACRDRKLWEVMRFNIINKKMSLFLSLWLGELF